MGAPAIPATGPAHRRLRRAVFESLAALLITAALVGAVERGAHMLGPVLIVVAALAGIRAVRAWWRDLEEHWYGAEIVLVTSGWALFAAAFAAIQYLSFSLIPGAFFVDVEYGKLVSPRYRAEWLQDSSRAGTALAELDTAIHLLQSGGPAALARDTTYLLPNGATLKVGEQCELSLTEERCPWQLSVVPGPGARPLELSIEAPEAGGQSLQRKHLQGELAPRADPLRREVAALTRKLADPAAFVQPRIADFLYDTAIAFSGRDSGVFVPIGALARVFHVLESLASYLLFGIVVSRVASATGERLGRSIRNPR
jgi:hypothetical protein